MSQPCRAPLKTNPFTTYRDPNTGRWQVIPTDSLSKECCDRSREWAALNPSSDVTVRAEVAIALDSR